MTVLAPEIDAFLREPNVASLATVRPDGRPHVTPVWYEYDGKEFIISTLRQTQKLLNVSRKGFAALCIYTQALPYRHVIVEGTARPGSPVDNVWRERVATVIWARRPVALTFARAVTGTSSLFTSAR